MVAAYAQLVSRAAHAEGVNAPKFRGLDLEVPEVRADLGHRHGVADFYAGSAADDLQHFVAYVHFADVQFVRLGMLGHFQKFSYYHVVIGHSDFLEAVHRHALGGHDLGQFLGSIGNVNKFFQPFVRYIHASPLNYSFLAAASALAFSACRYAITMPFPTRML